MGTFSADWLALREPADARARSSALVDSIRDACRSGFSRDTGKESRLKPLPQESLPRGLLRQEPLPHEPLSIIDLGAGTGANLRYLAPRLGGRQEWLLVDSDGALLGAARAKLLEWAATLDARVEADTNQISILASAFSAAVRTLEVDIARDLDALALPHRCLVTASALLDLVSRTWLEALADACREATASVLFALTYDGRLTLDPAEPDDELARALFNRHQHGDKGFGPALGPDAPATTGAAFARRGYALTTAASDWRLDEAARTLQAELIDGWLGAARDVEPDSRHTLERWHARHRKRIDAGQSRIVVGHSDLAGRL